MHWPNRLVRHACAGPCTRIASSLTWRMRHSQRCAVVHLPCYITLDTLRRTFSIGQAWLQLIPSCAGVIGVWAVCTQGSIQHNNSAAFAPPGMRLVQLISTCTRQPNTLSRFCERVCVHNIWFHGNSELENLTRYALLLLLAVQSTGWKELPESINGRAAMLGGWARA